MRSQVKKWGNSASVRIPARVLAAADMHIDQEVEMREEGGRIIIEPVAVPSYDLEDLLAAMKPENFPDEIDFGPPVGEEIW
ncbi:AbrB/MazE/SpoVT family DNA-binding domain-containing protein [Blastomonas aquatica]|uniref:Antitoxin MazE n=1 Tax=Blastomonas aquatica TaxID=1510276 RepID=A0ABQ1ISP7_9SPHN|nr:AbrB/MazE/SpoVT family DNA-binding domain-containing protein [Blastomonas aquatica]GGB50409.1 antitoxin MazE [Blastomonas aquatica]